MKGRGWVLAKKSVTWGEGVLEDQQGQTRGEGRSKLGNLEQTYFLNVPLWNLTRFTFLVQKNSLWSEIPRSIIPDWQDFSVEFVKIWSIRAEMLHGTRVGHLINCFKEWIWQFAVLQVLELQSVRYTYTTYNFQASNKSIKTLHLHNL